MAATQGTSSFLIPAPVSLAQYTWRIGGVLAGCLLLITGRYLDRSDISAAGAAITMVFSILLVLTVWAVYRADLLSGEQVVEQLYMLSSTQASDALALIGTGQKWPANVLGRHLTSGRLHAVDVYNPQLMPGATLHRARLDAPVAGPDPRITWYGSNLDLLPLPDNSVNAVFLCRVLSELVQDGDQRALLREIKRILAPNGRLLIAEVADAWPNHLLPGLPLASLKPARYWSDLAAGSGSSLAASKHYRD